MNLIILLLLIGMGITNPSSFFGIVTGIALCWFMFGEKGQESIKYHLTHWSWWDFRV